MWEKGDPASDPGDVHQGFYFKWTVKLGGQKAEIRIPGEGNPNPDSGDAAPYPELLTDGFFGLDGLDTGGIGDAGGSGGAEGE